MGGCEGDRIMEQSIFDEWVELNKVMFPYRSRFDAIKEKLNKCTTKEEAEKALKEEQYEIRYHILPSRLT